MKNSLTRTTLLCSQSGQGLYKNMQSETQKSRIGDLVKENQKNKEMHDRIEKSELF